jgi:hypothetical protein
MAALPNGYLTDDPTVVLGALERITGGIPADAPHAVQPAAQSDWADRSKSGRKQGKGGARRR